VRPAGPVPGAPNGSPEPSQAPFCARLAPSASIRPLIHSSRWATRIFLAPPILRLGSSPREIRLWIVALETPSTRAASVGETVMQPSGMVDKNLGCSSGLVIAKESRREPDGPARFSSVLPNSAVSVCSNRSPTVPCVLGAHTRLTHRVTHRSPRLGECIPSTPTLNRAYTPHRHPADRSLK